MQVTRRQPIHWCDGRRSKDNPMQLKKRVVDPSGNVVWLSLANGKAQTVLLGNNYAQWISAVKDRKGFIDYHECDSCQDVPSLDRDNPDPREQIVNTLCEKCAAREVVIETRQKAKDMETSEYQKLFETRLDKLAEVLENKLVVEDKRPRVSAEDLAEVMTAEPKEKKKVGRSRA